MVSDTAVRECAQETVNHAEKTVSWNVKMLLMSQGKSQAALSEALGVQRAAVSKKLSGLVSWSLADLVKTAGFLDTTVSALLDDSVMQMVMGDSEESSSEYKKTVAGNTRPRLFAGLLSETEFVAGHGFEPWTSGL